MNALTTHWHSAWQSLSGNASTAHLPWLVLTMAVYLAAMALYRRSGNHPLLIPVFTAVVVIVGVLLATGTSYASYRSGVSLLGLLIGPATVALAIPLYAQRERIRALWLPISVALAVGCVVALLSALLIGWSLGGIYAREVAKALPHLVRGVITLGTPFTGHPRATTAWRLYELAAGHKIETHPRRGRLHEAPPVPTTSVYSRSDGVVAWQCSVQDARCSAHGEVENIEVVASHFGLGMNPAALYAIADRLAGPDLKVLHQANAGLVQMDARKATKAREALRQFSCAELIEKCKQAADLYLTAELPLGNGTQTPEQFCSIQSATAPALAGSGRPGTTGAGRG